MNGDYQLDDTVYIPFTTRAFSTGIPTALVSGEVQIYEDASVTQITAAETLAVSLDSIAGFNMVSVVATTANGFESGKSYTLILSAGTVDSVSAVGEVVGQFTIEASAAALDLANGTDGLGAIKTETALIVADTGELQTNQGNWLTATGFATPTNITAGTIATVTNLTNLPTIPANWITAAGIATDAIGSDELAAGAVTKIWAHICETVGSRTAQQIMSLVLSAVAGVTDTGGIVFRDAAGTNIRISATVNGSNERTAVTLTPSA